MDKQVRPSRADDDSQREQAGFEQAELVEMGIDVILEGAADRSIQRSIQYVYETVGRTDVEIVDGDAVDMQGRGGGGRTSGNGPGKEDLLP